MVNQRFAFAVHIVAVLAHSRGVVDSTTIAASVNTNPVVVRRLLLTLRRRGLVRTCSGKHGGAALIKKPEQISLLEIYDAVQSRPVIALSRRDVVKRCPVSSKMQHIMAHVSEGADRALRAHLRTITLRRLLRQIR